MPSGPVGSRLALALVAAALVAACSDAQSVPCGDRVCEIGDVCTPGGCTRAADAQACAGLAEGAPCAPSSGGDGVCRLQACTAAAWSAQTLIGGDVQAASLDLGGQTSVAVDRKGALFIADSNHERVLRVDTSGIITTVAGNGTLGSGGDGSAATSAQLYEPSGLAIDGLGNLYIADLYNNRVRRVDTAGIITTVAGDGLPGFRGDGGAATAAQLNAPNAVAVDGLGNLYIADLNNNRVRRVDTSGIITTVAGGELVGFSGDGSAATAAQLNSPNAVALDAAGNLYIADSGNDRIRRVDPAGIITTFAGTGAFGYSGDGSAATSATLNFPTSVAVDGAGDVYLADSDANRIRRVSTDGIITTVAGDGTPAFAGDGGAATSAELRIPTSVAVDALGNLYISDTDNLRVRRVDAGGIITSVVWLATGAATSSELLPAGPLAVDGNGNLYVADSRARVWRADAAGVLELVAGNGAYGTGSDGSLAVDAALPVSTSIAVDGLGNLYVATPSDNRIRRVDPAGVLGTVAGDGVSGSGGDGGPATSAELADPTGIAVDAAGDLYIADTGNHVVRRVDPTGEITTVVGDGGSGSGGDGGPATSAELVFPTAVAVDGAGDLSILDAGDDCIRRVDAAGTIETLACGLPYPRGLAVDALDAAYVPDTNGARVLRIDPAGAITAVVGTGTTNITGDGGSASSATLDGPNGVAVDGLGNLYVAESTGVRRIDAAGIITTAAGDVDPDGVGPLARAWPADPQQMVVTPSFTLFAGGASGTVERAGSARIDAVAGRYEQFSPTGDLARYRDVTFGDVNGIAYDAAAGLFYLSEANEIDVVTIVDPDVPATWTIAALAGGSGAGSADGAAGSASFDGPAGLYLDAAAQQLYVTDAGNGALRRIDLASAAVTTIAASFGDPHAVTMCPNGDLFVADTAGDHVFRVHAGAVTTVLGDGTASSSGDGAPASIFPVDEPRGLACDAAGNLFVTSREAVREIGADAVGAVDGTGRVVTIYGAAPRAAFPENVTSCLTGLAVTDAATVQVVDACTGIVVELTREVTP